MKEGTKKNIYYELRTNDVRIKRTKDGTDYIFGRYSVHSYWGHLYICKLNPDNNVYVYLSVSERGTEWHDGQPKNTAYEIFIAAQNKANGKKYIDPYKNIPVDEVINDSVNRFDKMFNESAADIFPYDMPEQQYKKTIAKMRNIFAQNIRQFKTRTK